jgi:hypothetical protein
VDSDGGDGPVRNRAREKKVPWAIGAQVSRDDHRVATEEDLRSGGALRARAGAGDTGGTRGSTGGGGTTWKERGQPARGRGRHVDGRRAALGQRTWLARAAAARGRETEEIEGEVDEGGLDCKFQKEQGPHCNAQVTFKPVLKWRWAQKQKCRVFQNLQLCFKVHLQKSNYLKLI